MFFPIHVSHPTGDHQCGMCTARFDDKDFYEAHLEQHGGQLQELSSVHCHLVCVCLCYTSAVFLLLLAVDKRCREDSSWESRKKHRAFPSLSFHTQAEAAEQMRQTTETCPKPMRNPKAPLKAAIPLPVLPEPDQDENEIYHPWFEGFVASLIHAAKEAKDGEDIEYNSLHNTHKKDVLPASTGASFGLQPDFCFMPQPTSADHAINVDDIVDIKRRTKSEPRSNFSPTDCAQVQGYGERVLRAQPWRPTVDTALCDTAYFQAFEVSIEANIWRYYRTAPLHLSSLEGQNALLAFAEKSSSQVPEYPGMEIMAWLGKGSSSTVFLCRDNGRHQFVLKQHKSIDTASNEELALVALTGLPNVPTFVSRAGLRVLLQPFAEKAGNLTTGDVAVILDVLRSAHRKNILHRDISPENLLRDRNGAIIVNDWSSALVDQVPSQMAGGWYFASDQVLNLLIQQQEPAYRPQDDLHSLVRTIAFQVKSSEDLLRCAESTGIQKFWEKSLTGYWETVAEAAEGLDYDGLASKLEPFLKNA
jgi:hypothetical protein